MDDWVNEDADFLKQMLSSEQDRYEHKFTFEYPYLIKKNSIFREGKVAEEFEDSRNLDRLIYKDWLLLIDLKEISLNTVYIKSFIKETTHIAASIAWI